MSELEIQLSIPNEMLDSTDYWRGGAMRLQPEFAQWLEVNAPEAQVLLGIIWQIVTFNNEEQAALAKLAWPLQPVKRYNKPDVNHEVR